MQVTIDLEADLWEAARKKAQSQQTSLDSAMSELLRLGLAAESGTHGRAGFTFSLPGGVVTTDNVRAVLEDDDE